MRKLTEEVEKKVWSDCSTCQNNRFVLEETTAFPCPDCNPNPLTFREKHDQ